jgi:hypothetical protein
MSTAFWLVDASPADVVTVTAMRLELVVGNATGSEYTRAPGATWTSGNPENVNIAAVAGRTFNATPVASAMLAFRIV